MLPNIFLPQTQSELTEMLKNSSNLLDFVRGGELGLSKSAETGQWVLLSHTFKILYESWISVSPK